MLLLCLTAQVHVLNAAGEQGVRVDTENAAANDQIEALFDDDVGEPAPEPKITNVVQFETAQETGDLGEGMKSGKHVEFQYKDREQDAQDGPMLGESASTSVVQPPPLSSARRMIQLGSLLEGLAAGHQSHRTEAVQSLKDALQTKLLMDELKPADGSFAGTHPGSDQEAELGEDHVALNFAGSFAKLLKAKKEDMVAITKYLLERKKQGRPLTSKEDDELQKFYYNRASTILKKILLLKRGDEPAPKMEKVEPAHEINEMPNTMQDHASMEVSLARDHAQAVVERLNFDAKVATANAAYNKKMLSGKERRMKAAEEERKQAESQQLKAANHKLMYDQKVADSEEKYDEALSTELLQRKNRAEARVQQASQQKQLADVAAAEATSAANKADQEAKEAELEAEQATKHAEELEEKQLAKEVRKSKGKKPVAKKEKDVQIPLTVFPEAKLSSVLRYLRSALDKHLSITPEEQQLMQSFFLKRGSTLLSQLAQVDPDATWHSTGVMREEQYEMDQGNPDQLSKEWGSKNLKDDTVVKDFVHDALWATKSQGSLARPGAQQMVGLFGSNAKVHLNFDVDNSAPQTSEPDLGESDDYSDDDIDELQKANPGAFTTMMGLDEEEMA